MLSRVLLVEGYVAAQRETMKAINTAQKVVIALGLTACAVMVLFPPYWCVWKPGDARAYDFAGIAYHSWWTKDSCGGDVFPFLLLVQIGFAGLVTLIATRMLGSRADAGNDTKAT